MLDPKTRALCTVAMLACLGQQFQEVSEVLRQVAVYAGFPSAWNALATAKRALEDFEEAGS